MSQPTACNLVSLLSCRKVCPFCKIKYLGVRETSLTTAPGSHWRSANALIITEWQVSYELTPFTIPQIYFSPQVDWGSYTSKEHVIALPALLAFRSPCLHHMYAEDRHPLPLSLPSSRPSSLPSLPSHLSTRLPVRNFEGASLAQGG